MGICLALTIVLSYTLFVKHIVALGDNEYTYDLNHGKEIYAAYIKKYNRIFKDEDEYYRRYINFIRTLRTINNINRNPESETKVSPNEYADWSEDEKWAVTNMRALQVTTERIDPELKNYFRVQNRPEMGLALPGSAAFNALMNNKKSSRAGGSHPWIQMRR